MDQGLPPGIILLVHHSIGQRRLAVFGQGREQERQSDKTGSHMILAGVDRREQSLIRQFACAPGTTSKASGNTCAVWLSAWLP